MWNFQNENREMKVSSHTFFVEMEHSKWDLQGIHHKSTQTARCRNIILTYAACKGRNGSVGWKLNLVYDCFWHKGPFHWPTHHAARRLFLYPTEGNDSCLRWSGLPSSKEIFTGPGALKRSMHGWGLCYEAAVCVQALMKCFCFSASPSSSYSWMTHCPSLSKCLNGAVSPEGSCSWPEWHTGTLKMHFGN